MLLEQLQTILDFPFHPYKAIEEAQKKLQGTWCKVNGNLVYIESFENDSLQAGIPGVSLEDIPGDEVESFELFLPKPGYYKYKGITLELRKSAKKQWKKSFNYNLYHFINPPDGLFSIDNISLVDWDSWSLFSKIGNTIYYLGNKIAIRKKDEVECINHLFYQELLDESKRNGVWNVL